MEKNLKVHISEDGVWLTFLASNNKSATLNIEALANNYGPITGSALEQWCADRRKEFSA